MNEHFLALRFTTLLAPIIIALTACTAQAQQYNDAPYGLWQWHEKGSKAEFELTITLRSGACSALLDGIAVACEKEAKTFALSLADGQQFVASVQEDGAIHGTWTQPPSEYGFYSAMATFVSLPASSKTRWRGTVKIQPRPFHLFLDVFKTADGKVKAALRNPQRNDILGASLYDVLHIKGKGNKQQWKLFKQGHSGDISIPFTYLTRGIIQLNHRQIPNLVEFTPATSHQLEKYYSRKRQQQAHQYSNVRNLDDGWDALDAVADGFDEELLNQLINNLASADPRSERPQMVHSLLVSYQGKLAFEEYFFGYSAKDVHDTRSLSKVFGSVLIGAAQQQGYEITPSYSPLPDILEKNGLSASNKASLIKLSHFLTYTSGLDAAENPVSLGSEDRLWAQSNDDFWLYTAQLPILHPPGTRYAYASASANMVGAALNHKVNKPVREFFHKTLAIPLKFATYHWNLTPNGSAYLGGGVYMRPRDILKIGALYAAKGKWDGRQIVPESWISLSTSPKIDITAKTTGLSDEDFANNYSGGSQAYIWTVANIESKNKSYTSYTASGNGGQLLIVVPELELAVVFTGGNYRMFSVWGKWRQQIVGEYIIPSLPNINTF